MTSFFGTTGQSPTQSQTIEELIALVDDFETKYLGPKASDPTTDNDGNALIDGAIYFNTTTDGFKAWNGSAWISPVGATGPAGAGVASGGTTGQVLRKASNTDYDTEWFTASGTGTVTSVGIAVSGAGLSVSGSPVTSSGNITLTVDSDLSSWAGVTRAAGFDTFAATPSSANLRALLTDENGTGAAYFQGGDAGTPSAIVLTNATGAPASAISSGVIATARLGSGTADSTTFLRGDNTWATPAGGGGVSDGDKGDITVSGGGAVWTIDAGAVTLADMANLAANSIIGNNTGSAATPIALTAAQVKSLLAVASSDVTDFNEAVDDRVGALLVAGSNITLTYNDGANTLTIASTGGGGGGTNLGMVLATNRFVLL